MSIVEIMDDAYDKDLWGNTDKSGASKSGMKAMRAALRAAEEAGWVLVPKEPTDKMISEAYDTADYDTGPAPAQCWSAMLAARPEVK